MSENNGVEKIPRKGWVRFQLGDDEDAAFEVDLFLAYNAWRTVHQEYADDDGSELPHYQELVKSWGGPADVTAAEAVAVVDRLAELVEAEKKSDGPESSSPTDSDSPASTSTSGPET